MYSTYLIICECMFYHTERLKSSKHNDIKIEKYFESISSIFLFFPPIFKSY